MGEMAKEKKGLTEPPENIKVVVLNGSLKPGEEFSNTGDLCTQVVDEMGSVESEFVRLSRFDIKPGIERDMGKGDDWPHIAGLIEKADAVIFGTPIWWGQRSSHMQRVIERMDSFDEVYRQTGKSPLYNKVAGIVVTGSEDGAQAITSGLMSTLSWMGFVIPPEAAAYWVGEVGMDPRTETARRKRNSGVDLMVSHMAHSILHYSRLAKSNPLKPQK